MGSGNWQDASMSKRSVGAWRKLAEKLKKSGNTQGKQLADYIENEAKGRPSEENLEISGIRSEWMDLIKENT